MPPSDPTPPRRFFLECTRTWNSSLHTGIERVVRNVVAASHDVGRSLGVDCVPVVHHPARGFVAVDVASKWQGNQAFSRPQRSRLKRQLDQWGLLPAARRLNHRLRNSWTFAQQAFRGWFRSHVEFRQGDVLLLLDSSWQSPYWKDVETAQSRGSHVGVVIYDLLPLQFPSAFTPVQVNVFKSWWKRACQQADFVAAISQSVLNDARRFHEQQQGKTGRLLGRSFRLGANLNAQLPEVTIRDPLQAIFDGLSEHDCRPTYLSVGTLSPRKNQALILDAFDRLWETGSSLGLLFAGNSGWHSEAFIRRVEAHAEYGRRLFWFEDLDDGELDFCYRRAAGLITASYGEGFNLPIVEALHRRCPVLASDIEVHQEVGGGFVEYFPAGDAESLAFKLLDHQRRGAFPSTRPLTEFCWPDWTESCVELLGRIQAMIERTGSKAQPSQTAA